MLPYTIIGLLLFLAIISECFAHNQHNTELQHQYKSYYNRNIRTLSEEYIWCYNNCSSHGSCNESGCLCEREQKYYVGWDCSKTANVLLPSEFGIPNIFTIKEQSSLYVMINLSEYQSSSLIFQFETTSEKAIAINTYNASNYLISDQSQSIHKGKTANIRIDGSQTYLDNLMTIQIYSYFSETEEIVKFTTLNSEDKVVVDTSDEVYHKLTILFGCLFGLFLFGCVGQLFYYRHKLKMEKEKECRQANQSIQIRPYPDTY